MGWVGFRSLRDRGHWAWSHVIHSLYGKPSDWSDCSEIRGHEMMFFSRYGHISIGRSGENSPLERRGVRVLTKFSRTTNRNYGYSNYPEDG